MNTQNEIPYMTMTEAAAVLNRSLPTLWRYVRDGKFANTVKKGNRTLIADADVHALRQKLGKGRIATPPKP